MSHSMSGTFKVVGTFRVKRVGLIAYGDVMTGSVSNGELLLILLNSGLSISVPIRSVEAIDGTTTGSHIALVLAADSALEMSMLEPLQFAGEVLHVDRAQEEGDSRVAQFEVALERFHRLLAATRWPEQITWIGPQQVRSLPKRTFIYQPVQKWSDALARRTFENGRRMASAVSLSAVGRGATTTYAVVSAIHELAQGEGMFVLDGVKVSVPHVQPTTIIVRSRLFWCAIRRARVKWLKVRRKNLGRPNSR